MLVEQFNYTMEYASFHPVLTESVLLSWQLLSVWPGGVMVLAIGLATQDVLVNARVRLPAVVLSVNNLGQVVHTHLPLLPSSMSWSLRSRVGDAVRLGR